MRILIPTNVLDNKGLLRDAEVLRDLLQSWGHLVGIFDFRTEPTAHGWDLTIHLEHVEPHHLRHAPRNWYIPNAEWHVGGAREATADGRFERILVKTRQAERIFSPMAAGVVYVGFECRDRLLAGAGKERAFLHAPGQSGFRGTGAVVQASERARLPVLIPRAMDEEQFRREQNRCAFHLCTSEMEGWGHGIHEAMSVGAVVVSVAHPPMDEFDGVAYRIQPEKTEPFRLVERAILSRDGVRAAMAWCMALDGEQIAAHGAAARAAFERGRDDFRERLLDIVGRAER